MLFELVTRDEPKERLRRRLRSKGIVINRLHHNGLHPGIKQKNFDVNHTISLHFQVYQGRNTKYQYDSLPASTEVRFRVCAVRLMNAPSGSPGPIKGVFSPVTSARTMTPKKKKKKISESSAEGDDQAMDVKETKTVSLTDKQWAMIFFTGFSLLVVVVILLLPSLFGVSD